MRFDLDFILRKDVLLGYFAIIIFCGFLISIALNSKPQAYAYTFFTIILIEETLNFREMIRQVIQGISKIYKKYETFIWTLGCFLIFPFIITYMINGAIGISQETDIEIQDATLELYSIYITISTVLLSAAFIIISLFPILKEKSRRSIEFTWELKKLYIIFNAVVICSIITILLSLLGYFLNSIIAIKTISPFTFYEYFLCATFFAIGVILGTWLLANQLGKVMIRGRSSHHK